MRWFSLAKRRIHGNRGSSSLEQALIAALAAAVAAVFAAGVGKAGVNSSQTTQKQVQKATAESQASLSRKGDIMMLNTGQGGAVNVVFGNRPVTRTGSRLVQKVNFVIENNSPSPIDVGKLMVEYGDATQRTRLCAGNVTVNGRLLKCGSNVDLFYLRGSPLAGSSKGTATIKKGDTVRVIVTVSGLSRKLAEHSNFHISLVASNGRPLVVRARTPASLRPVVKAL